MATPEEQVDSGRNRGAQIAIILLAVVAALALVWFLFLRSDEPTETSAPVTPTSPSSSAPTLAPKKPAKKGPVETFEVFAPKDPFKPLISSPSATGTTTTSTTTSTSTSTSGTGTSTGGGNTTSTSTGGGGAPGETSTVSGHRVRVVNVFRSKGRDQAQIEVDGTVYTVGKGDRFAKNFKLLSTSGSCATMLFGDDQFSLCEGEEILK